MEAVLIQKESIDLQWGCSRDGSPFLWRAQSRDCAAIATALSELGLKQFDRVGICLENSPTVVALVQTATRLGICIVLFNPRLDHEFLREHIDDAQLQCCFSDLTLESETKIYSSKLLNDYLANIEHAHFDFSAHPLPPLNSPCVVLMSSGSSGTHKFIRLSYSAILHASDAAMTSLQLSAADCWLACLPFYHIGGLSIIYRAAMIGADIVCCTHFDEEAINTLINHGHISGMSLVPTMLHRLLKNRTQHWPKSLRCILLGGAAWNQNDCERSQELGCAPLRSYGMSEFASQIATQSFAQAQQQQQDCGSFIHGIEHSINDAGILCLRGPQSFSGYETHGTLNETRSDTAWFETKDHAHLNNFGHLIIDGRSDDIFMRGGENISLREIQQIIDALEICDASCLCCITDPEWGQVPVLVYVGSADPAHMETQLQQQLNGLQRPHAIKKLESLPVLANGKTDRVQIQALFLNANN